jgi:phosphoglycolate phosphatase
VTASPGPIRAVLLDLDGTLADTAGEIGRALAMTLRDFGIEPLQQEEVVSLIGRGVQVLVERALAKRGAAIESGAAVKRFHEHYHQTIATDAQLYPGARQGIERLRAAGCKLAVVTNKPRFYSEKLLLFFDLSSQMDTLVAGDDGIARKPAADMILAACQRLGVTPAEAIMLGDSDNDVLSARAAGCRAWCVPYGYNEGRPVEELECDRIVATIAEAAQLVIGSRVIVANATPGATR